MAVEAALPAAIRGFLRCATPGAWVEQACRCLPDLLLDHANCELKAASTALSLIYRYADDAELCSRMSRLAREELRHFEQVRALLVQRDIPFRRLTASRYASELRAAIRSAEPGYRTDTLIAGALIEARSCERFAALIPGLPDDIGRFYSGLLSSEARHFQHYLDFARASCAPDDNFERRVNQLRQIENELILSPDPQFRFHSGVPADS